MTGLRSVAGVSAAYLSVTLAETLAGLLTISILTRYLTRADYGVLLLIANGAAIINVLFVYSLAQALPSLLTRADDDPQRGAVATTIMFAIAAFSVCFYGVVAIGAASLSAALIAQGDYTHVLRLAAFSFCAGAISLSLASIVRLRELHRIYVRVQLSSVAINLIVMVCLVTIAGLGLAAVYVGVGAAAVFSAAAYVRGLGPLLAGRFEMNVLKSALGVGANMLPWQAATMLTTAAAGLVLAIAGRLEEAGLFAVAATIASPLNAISTSFTNGWTPYVLNRQGDASLPAVQRRTFAAYSAGMLLLASALGLFSREIFAVLVSANFQDGALLVPPLALAFSIFGFANAFAQGLQARQRTVHYAWIGALAALAFLGVAALLVRSLGALGIIGAMIAGFATMLVGLQLVSERLMAVGYPWGRHALGWALAAALVASLAPLEPGPGAGLAKIAAIGAIVGSAMVTGALRMDDVRRAIRQVSTAIGGS